VISPRAAVGGGVLRKVMRGSFRALMGSATESEKESRCVGRGRLSWSVSEFTEAQAPLAPTPSTGRISSLGKQFHFHFYSHQNYM
jgi:hypothetical protein